MFTVAPHACLSANPALTYALLMQVRISRRHLLESALKVFELYASAKSQLEIEYFGEVGTGEAGGEGGGGAASCKSFFTSQLVKSQLEI